MKLLIIIFIIWIYVVISNLYCWSKTIWLYKRFNSDKEITSYIPEIDELFKKAGTSYKSIYDEHKNGFRQRELKDISYLCDKKQYKHEVEKVFLVTIGTFRTKLKRSFFPVHIVFLPNYLFKKKDLYVPSIIRFLLTLIYWCVSFCASYLANSFLDYFYLNHLQLWFDKIL